MLKFYTLTQEITPEHRRRIFPLLFDWCYLEDAELRTHFQQVATLEEAEVAILPIDLGYYLKHGQKKEVDRFIQSAKEAHKKVWVYSGGDFGTTLSEEVTTFRLGGFHSKMNANTNVMPSFINDPYEVLLTGTWFPLTKTEKPTIGFVGNAEGSFNKWLKEFLIYGKQSLNRLLKKDPTDWQSFFPSSIIRFQMLQKIKESSRVQTDFIYRNKYRAGATNEEEKRKTSLVFYQNIEKNLYTFCLRGSGNFSVRFYETLMMGRIPLLIDTDVRLPFHDTIQWHQHCVLATRENYIEKLVDFHQQHSEYELKKIQESNRQLAKEVLNRKAYFIAISKEIMSS